MPTPPVRTILGEADAPQRWSHLPGYGDTITDPKRIPPYVEDLGNGVTRAVGLNRDEHWYWHGKREHANGKPTIEYPPGFERWGRYGEPYAGPPPEIIPSKTKARYQHDRPTA